MSLHSITLPHNNKQQQLANWFNKEKWEKNIDTWSSANKKKFCEQSVVLQSRGSLSYQWLDALPNKNMGQTMSNEAYIAMLKFRYLIPIGEEREDGLCQNCGKEGDMYGYHVTKCGGKQNGTHTRHQTLVGTLVALFRGAGFHPKKDANVRCLGNSYGGNLRPANISADGEGRLAIKLPHLMPFLL